ncbi:hypothetical protein [Streptomyces sp. NPDC093544]
MIVTATDTARPTGLIAVDRTTIGVTENALDALNSERVQGR